ncbi:MAG TPA: asparagine synthase-related protein [Egibacteraceae bacterium]|nr:asparagine synthase-related protein [Egibacteraceae bacterium]
MNLAPLADVVAYIDPDPTRLRGVKQVLDSRFDKVWSPNPRCVMATRALAHSVPDGEDLRESGVAFAEGRDAIDDRRVARSTVESLPGNVGLVRVDGDKLVVVRSGPGTVPWYAWQDGHRALVATRFTELLALLPSTPELDPLVCAMWASFQPAFPDGRSFVRGVTVIPPGHTAEVGAGEPVRCRRWWDPWPDDLPWPSRASAAHHVERFRHAVLKALEGEVAEEPVNVLTLSGGVDSSALAYLVVRHLGRPMSALSFVPPEEGPEARLEASYLDALVADLTIAPHLRRPLSATERLVLMAGTPPVAFPVMHPALQVLPELVAEWGVEVLLGGEWADEVCGGWFAYSDWLDAVSLPRLIGRWRALPKGRRDVLAWARRRIPGRLPSGPWRASLSESIRPEVHDEYQAWRGEQLTVVRRSIGLHRYQQAVLASLEGALAMNWEVCSFLGVRRAFPFLTAEVLEVVSSCHPVELLGPGPKRLERRAFTGLVPDRFLCRPDKSGWRSRDDDTPVHPCAVPDVLGATFRENLGHLAPIEAAGVALVSQFADQALAAQTRR